MMHKSSGTPSFEPELTRAGLEITKTELELVYIGSEARIVEL
jgi:hypothetical protein